MTTKTRSLKAKYQEEIIPALTEKFGYKNINQVPKLHKIVLNMVTKAQKPQPMAGIQGGLIKVEAPVDASNVMVICPACEKPTRIKHAVVDGKKVRVCKKCGAIIK